jgi:nitroreductase
MEVGDIDLESVDHVLTTTRAVRRRLDLSRTVDTEVIERCIEVALQAPTGLYGETAHFVVVNSLEKRKQIASIIQKAGAGLRTGRYPLDPYLAGIRAENSADARYRAQQRLFSDGEHLAVNLDRVPMLIFACAKGRVENSGSGAQASFYGSIMPATWSLMLGLRARGIGSCLVTFWIHNFEREVAEVLEIPPSVTVVAMLPVGHFTGADFKPARRAPARERTYWNEWGSRR